MLKSANKVTMPQALTFVHRGLPSYLLCSLFQAHAASSEIRIVLISDINPRISFVEWLDISCYSDSFSQMADVYVHLSTNEEWFERFCFYRWFVLCAAMEKLGLMSLIHVDSDVTD